MTNDQIISILQKWQQDGMTKSRGVFVHSFALKPQSQGFMLDLEIHEDGVTGDGPYNYPSSYLYGKSLSELFDKAAALIEQKKNELRKALNE